MILTDKIGWGQPLVDKSLLYLWDASEGSGSTTADRIAGVKANLNSGVSWKTSLYGKCIYTDGSTGDVDTGVDVDFERTDPFSVSIVAKITGDGDLVNKLGPFSNPVPPYGDYPGWVIFTQTGQVAFFIQHKWLDGTNRIRLLTVASFANAWHTITCTYDGSSTVAGMHTYIDGVDVSRALSGTLALSILNNNNVHMGSRTGGSSPVGEGTNYIKQVGIWNRELSLAEHQYMYRNVTIWPYLSVQEEVYRAAAATGNPWNYYAQMA